MSKHRSSGFTVRTSPSGDYARTQAGFGSPPLLGSYCIFASAVVAQGDDVISARLRRVTQIALAVTVLSTVSRAIVGFALAVMIRNARTPSLRAVAIAATAICVGFLALLTFTRVSLDPSRPFDTELSTATDSGREQKLKASVDTLREHPIFGTGPGSLPGEAVGYGPRDAHNTPVGVAATLGLPALGALLALFLSCGGVAAAPQTRRPGAAWPASQSKGSDTTSRISVMYG